MCNGCKDHHKKFKKLRGHTISDVKEPKQQDAKSKHTGPSLTDGVLQTSDPEAAELHTPPSDRSRDGRELHATAPSLDTHTSAESQDAMSSSSPSEPFSILNLSLQSVKVVKIKSSEDESMRIHGCVFMPSGQLLLVNNYESEVLHLDSSFTIRERVNISAIEITAISENVAVVVDSNGISFLEVKPKLRVVKSVSLGESIRSRGVAAGGGLIYVPSNGNFSRRPILAEFRSQHQSAKTKIREIFSYF